MQPSGGAVGDLLKAGMHLYAIAKDLSTPEEYRFQLWNVNSGQRTQSFQFQGAKPLCLAASSNGSRALLGTKARAHIFGLGQT